MRPSRVNEVLFANPLILNQKTAAECVYSMFKIQIRYNPSLGRVKSAAGADWEHTYVNIMRM